MLHFKRNLQFLCLQWKWCHPLLIICNVPHSTQSPKRTLKSDSSTPTFSLSNYYPNLWLSSGISLAPPPSLYQHCNHSLQASVFSGLDSTTGPPLASGLGSSHNPTSIPFIATTAFLQMKTWALRPSRCKLPCCPVAFSLKSKLLRMSRKAPQLQSAAPLSRGIFHSSFPHTFRQRNFEQFIVSRFSPVSVLFLKLLPLPETFSPSYLVSYSLTLLTSFHFSKPFPARDESLLWEEMKIVPFSVLWSFTRCSGVRSPRSKS